MASQYQHRQFFRRVPNRLLADYFESRDTDLGVDFEQLKETEIEPVFEAFINLPEEAQAAMEVDFQNIDALATDGGIGALLNEAAFREDDTFPERISPVDGHHAKVMTAFLDKPEYWKGAAALLHADNVAGRFWNKRNDLPSVPPAVDDKDIKQLADAISRYFYETEGRGRNCKVEPYRKVETGKEYFFAYPEDYGQIGMEWERARLTNRSRHPAFQIIFVYSEDEGSLDIHAPRNTKAVPKLQKIFAKHILKLDTLPDGTIDKRVYDLNPLADPNFEFEYPPNSGIQEIIVTKLRLTLKHGLNRRVVLEANTKHNSMAVYDLLKELSPPPYYISQTRIKVVFEGEPGKRTNSISFNVGYPNFCNLTHIGKDNVLRQMLSMSGIEPHSQSAEAAGDSG